MFRGEYQFVGVDIDPPLPWHGSGRVVHIMALDERTAANPDVIVGVLVQLTNGIDRILIVNEDAYEIGSVPFNQSNQSHPWCNKEGYNRYYGYKKPDGTAKMIMDLLNVKEK